MERLGKDAELRWDDQESFQAKEESGRTNAQQGGALLSGGGMPALGKDHELRLQILGGCRTGLRELIMVRVPWVKGSAASGCRQRLRLSVLRAPYRMPSEGQMCPSAFFQGPISAPARISALARRGERRSSSIAQGPVGGRIENVAGWASPRDGRRLFTGHAGLLSRKQQHVFLRDWRPEAGQPGDPIQICVELKRTLLQPMQR